MEEPQGIEQTIKQPRGFTCLRWVLLSTAVVLVICSSAYLLPVIVSNYRAQEHQRTWNEYGSDDYTITLFGDRLPHELHFAGIEITFEVCDNRIVRVNNQPCSDSSNPDKCDMDPVTILFQEARECSPFCAVEFDSGYGFPHTIEYQNPELNMTLSIFDYAPISCP